MYAFICCDLDARRVYADAWACICRDLGTQACVFQDLSKRTRICRELGARTCATYAVH